MELVRCKPVSAKFPCTRENYREKATAPPGHSVNTLFGLADHKCSFDEKMTC